MDSNGWVTRANCLSDNSDQETISKLKKSQNKHPRNLIFQLYEVIVIFLIAERDNWLLHQIWWRDNKFQTFQNLVVIKCYFRTQNKILKTFHINLQIILTLRHAIDRQPRSGQPTALENFNLRIWMSLYLMWLCDENVNIELIKYNAHLSEL